MVNLGAKQILLISITAVTGIVILSGYFIDDPVLNNLRAIILQWTIILAAVALLVGVINLISVHFSKVITRKRSSIYSLVILVSFFITLIVGALYGPTNHLSLWIFNYVQLPVETSLLGITAVILILAAIRMLYRRPNTLSIIFLFITVIIMVGTVSIPWLEPSLLTEARDWILRIPVTGAARGIIIGIALGTIATGLRVLMGADRPYEN
ncbi:MAG: hypothetical protein U9R58_13525 [Chloroflexota bacterium]|nr:hypothetical protein [Chloroflexota bacterium]